MVQHYIILLSSYWFHLVTFFDLLPPLVSVMLLELPMCEAASTPRTVSRVLMLPDVVPRLDWSSGEGEQAL